MKCGNDKPRTARSDSRRGPVNAISRLLVGCERLDIKIRNKFMDMVGKYVIAVEFTSLHT